MSFYERIAASPDGLRRLAIARLTTAVSEEMHTALDDAGITADEAYRYLSRRQRRALKNIDITTGALAAFLHACGREMTTQLVPAGQPRAEVLARRAAFFAEQQHGDAAEEGER